MSSDHHGHAHGHAHRTAAPRPDYEPAQQALTLYYRALSGRACELVPYDDDSDPWQHPDTSTTVRLPSHPPLDEGNGYTGSQWYQVAMTHRAMHHALGTFRLDMQRPEPLFVKLRPATADVDTTPPLERFARLFGRTALAIEVFAVLEDLRIDAAAMRRFAGLAGAYRSVRKAALRERPDLTLLP